MCLNCRLIGCNCKSASVIGRLTLLRSAAENFLSKLSEKLAHYFQRTAWSSRMSGEGEGAGIEQGATGIEESSQWRKKALQWGTKVLQWGSEVLQWGTTVREEGTTPLRILLQLTPFNFPSTEFETWPATYVIIKGHFKLNMFVLAENKSKFQVNIHIFWTWGHTLLYGPKALGFSGQMECVTKDIKVRLLGAGPGNSSSATSFQVSSSSISPSSSLL